MLKNPFSFPVFLLVLAACTSNPSSPAATARLETTATPSVIPTGTPTPEPSPDPEIGEELFNNRYLETSGRHCGYCHKLTEIGSGIVPLIGIATVAGERVEGMSAEAYIRQSILEPRAYTVEGYNPDAMPEVYGIIMSEEEIDDLVAFLMTQK